LPLTQDTRVRVPVSENNNFYIASARKTDVVW
jgi:hypothetical protein